MAPENPAVDALLSFKLNEMLPFDTSPADLARTSLESAHALAVMLGSAFIDSEETAHTNSDIVCHAFNGIARLVALAAFAGEAA